MLNPFAEEFRWNPWRKRAIAIGSLVILATLAGVAGAQPVGGNGWGANAVQWRGLNNNQYSYGCPQNGGAGSLWGTDTYTDDSSVCTAAVHKGLISLSGGGNVVIEIRPGQTSYAGSTRNGITSNSYGSWSGSFVLVGSAGSGPAPGGNSWSANAVPFRGANNSQYKYTCPPNGTAGSLWGTDTYTDDSSVCTAAVHKGLISLSGGGNNVVIEIRPGQSSYLGSTRNGITSSSYGNWSPNSSFIFPGSGGGSPALTISKSAPSSVTSGGTLTYTITYGNAGSVPAGGVILSDSIPAGTTFVSATNSGIVNAGAVTWNISSLGAGVSGQIVSFTVMVTATSGTITNSIYSIQANGVSPVFGSPVSTTVGGGGGGGGSPNLLPYQPSTWSDKIVIAKTTGTKTDSPSLASTDSLFLAFAVANIGSGPTAARFYIDLYIDGTLSKTFSDDPPLNSGFYDSLEDYSIGSLPGGTHTIRIKMDSTNAIAESNENDNEYTKTITVAGGGAACVQNAATLCLNNNRFAVTASWQSTSGSGVGTAVPIVNDTGTFWFFSSANYEILVKVVNGCAFNNNYWVFAGGLTNVRVTLRITDTQTGQVKTYENPLSTAFLPIQDTAAFATCP